MVMAEHMRVVVCGHTAVHPENRRRREKFAKLYPDAQLTLIVPERWEVQRYGRLEDFRPEEEHRVNYHVVPVPLGQWRDYKTWRSLGSGLRVLKPDVLDVVEYTFAPMCLQPLLYRRLYLPGTRTTATTNENQRYQFDTLIRRWRKRFVFGSVDGFSCENVEAADCWLGATRRNTTLLPGDGCAGSPLAHHAGLGRAIR